MSWPTARLGSIAEIVREGVDPSRISTGTNYVGLENILSDGSISEAVRVDAGDLASTKFAFTEQHILFGKLRPYLRKTARPTFAGICSTDIIPIAPTKRVAKDFLFHFLRTDEVVSKATTMSSGANLPRISPKHLIDFEIPLPPLDEQRRIAAILDQADALRRKRREALSYIGRLPSSLFADTFGKYGAAERCKLEDVCDLITDGTHYTPTYADSGVVFLSAKNVTTGYIDWNNVKNIPISLHNELRKRVAPRRGDVLLAKNGTTGVAALVDQDLAFDIYVSLALVRAGKRIIPEFLLSAINAESTQRQFKSALKGIGVSNLHLIDIRNTKIPCPLLSAQEAFVQQLRRIEFSRERALGAVRKLAIYFDRLLV
jgi:type I restriction enzyme S subunit